MTYVQLDCGKVCIPDWLVQPFREIATMLKHGSSDMDDFFEHSGSWSSFEKCNQAVVVAIGQLDSQTGAAQAALNEWSSKTDFDTQFVVLEAAKRTKPIDLLSIFDQAKRQSGTEI
jgi:hypothetical protein